MLETKELRELFQAFWTCSFCSSNCSSPFCSATKKTLQAVDVDVNDAESLFRPKRFVHVETG